MLIQLTRSADGQAIHRKPIISTIRILISLYFRISVFPYFHISISPYFRISVFLYFCISVFHMLHNVQPPEWPEKVNATWSRVWRRGLSIEDPLSHCSIHPYSCISIFPYFRISVFLYLRIPYGIKSAHHLLAGYRWIELRACVSLGMIR